MKFLIKKISKFDTTTSIPFIDIFLYIKNRFFYIFKTYEFKINSLIKKSEKFLISKQEMEFDFKSIFGIKK